MADPIAAQFLAPMLVGAVLIGLVFAVVASSIVIVDATEKRALTVFDEYQGVLEPGIRFVPPFVSDTRRYDMRTQQFTVTADAETTDGESVTVEATVDIHVDDVETLYHADEDFPEDVDRLARTTVQTTVAPQSFADLEPRWLEPELETALTDDFESLGIAVEDVEDVTVEQ